MPHHRPRKALPLLLGVLLVIASGAPAGATDPVGDDLATAEAALARCSGPAVSRSPEEVLAAAAAAEEAYDRLLASAPLVAHLGLARTLLECRIEAAPMFEKVALMQRIESHLQEALVVDPDNREGHLLYGVLLYHVPPFLGRSDEAVAHFERLVELAATAPPPAPPEVYLFLGELHLRQGRAQAAIEAWRRGLVAHPEADELAERLRRSSADPAAEEAPEASPAAPADTEDPEGPADDGLSQLVRRQVAGAAVPGIAVAAACGDQVLLLAGFGLADVENEVPMTADSVVRIGSVTKQFTAVVVLRLAEAGVLAVDRPIAHWLPARSATVEGITLHQLLTHTAGLPRDPAAGADWLGDSLAAPRGGRPGERYAYSNLGYALLGRVLEVATGESLTDLLEHWAIAPAGLAATAPCDERRIVPGRAGGYTWQGDRLVNADPVGGSPALLAAGGLCSTARDLLRWQRALHGGELLTAASHRLLITPPAVVDAAGTTYAAGLRVDAPRGRPVIHHSGATSGFLAEVAHHPADDLSVVVLANSDAADPRRLGYDLAERVLAARRGRCATLAG